MPLGVISGGTNSRVVDIEPPDLLGSVVWESDIVSPIDVDWDALR